MPDELEKRWKQLSRLVPLGTDPYDRERMRACFYAGAYEVFHQIDIGPPQTVISRLNSMREEVQRILDVVRDNLAKRKDQPYTSPHRRLRRK